MNSFFLNASENNCVFLQILFDCEMNKHYVFLSLSFSSFLDWLYRLSLKLDT